MMAPWLLGWLRGVYEYRLLHDIPNYPIEVLAIVTPANDNRQLHPHAYTDALILAHLTVGQLGLRHGITRSP